MKHVTMYRAPRVRPASTNIQKKVVRWPYLIRAWLVHNTLVCPPSSQL